MQVTIVMSPLVYDGFVDKCDQASREYAILRNGLIVQGNRSERIVEIRCAMDEAHKLLFLASRIYPEAVEDIKRAIAAH
jgi:hypothetical protein